MHSYCNSTDRQNTVLFSFCFIHERNKLLLVYLAWFEEETSEVNGEVYWRHGLILSRRRCPTGSLVWNYQVKIIRSSIGAL